MFYLLAGVDRLHSDLIEDTPPPAGDLLLSASIGLHQVCTSTSPRRPAPPPLPALSCHTASRLIPCSLLEIQYMWKVFVSMQVIAFISGWKMTLVVTAVVPLLGLAAYINTKFMGGFSSEVCMLLAYRNLTPSNGLHSFIAYSNG